MMMELWEYLVVLAAVTALIVAGFLLLDRVMPVQQPPPACRSVVRVIDIDPGMVRDPHAPRSTWKRY